MNQPDSPRTFALVGPGRAGTTVALALMARGWRAVAVAGRSFEAPSTRAAVARLGCAPAEVADAGRTAGLVVIATPDDAITEAAAALAPGCASGALVLHLSGARGLDALAPIARTRPDVAVGAMHPLQTFPGPDPARLDGAWAAVAGPAAVTELACSLGLRPFVVADERRAAYHAAAVVASNHLVALLGQVERLAAAAGAPLDAFWPLVHASVANAHALGPAAALTGPVARGDAATVMAHLATLAPEEREAYRALAAAALVLSGRTDPELADLVSGVPA